jgi:acetyl-CoA synthetase
MADAVDGGPATDAIAAWVEAAEALTWAAPWSTAYQPPAQPGPGTWFVGGRLSAAANCLDRHLPAAADRVAIYWEGEPGDRLVLTYGELHAQVVRATAAFARLGIGPRDRVALYLGWLPETVVAMLACARLGAVHAVLPAPLPADALADRLTAIAPKMLITQDGAWRHGTVLPLKARADEAQAAGGDIDVTIVVRRCGVDVAWYEGDLWWHDAVSDDATADPPATFDAGHPLLVAAVASRRARVMAALHGTGGLLTYAATIHRRGLVPAPDDVLWCAADISWLPSQAHGVYGPLANGATTVMFEGMVDVPSHERAWEIVNRYGVGTLLTTHTVVRRLHAWARDPAARLHASLKRVIIAGEPIDVSVRRWLSDLIGADAVLDGWGQFELGGIVTLDPVQPGVPDAGLDIVDDRGDHAATGELVVRNPWPGVIVGFDGADGSEHDFRWGRYPGVYATRDAARRRPDGSIEVLGRIDAVLNVSGHLLSLTAVADLLRDHPFVRDADVVERLDAASGRGITAVVVAEDGYGGSEALAQELKALVHDTLGGLARPRTVVFIDAFPPDVAVPARRRALRMLCDVLPGDPATITSAQLRTAAHAGDVTGDPSVPTVTDPPHQPL